MAQIAQIPEDKYGENRVVGFTDDGNVWLVYDCRSPDGQPMQMREVMTPKQAMELAKNIIEAAGKAHEKVRPLIVVPGGN